MRLLLPAALLAGGLGLWRVEPFCSRKQSRLVLATKLTPALATALAATLRRPRYRAQRRPLTPRRLPCWHARAPLQLPWE
jgi:hypothetical protein